MSTVRKVDSVATLADNGSTEITVHNIAHGSADHGWGHAYFRAYCDQCGWVGHEQGFASAIAAERMAITHASMDPHSPAGANRWIEENGMIGGYDGSD